MIEAVTPVGETQRDLIPRRRYAFTVSPQSDQLANFRDPRHFRDQLVLDGQGGTRGLDCRPRVRNQNRVVLPARARVGCRPLGTTLDRGTIPAFIRTMSGKFKAFSFWERHGTNSTWDPFGFCHGKRGG